MEVTIAGRAGPASVSDGVEEKIRLGRLADIILSELQPRYFEQTFRKNSFHSVAAGVTTSIGLNTTHTGLALSNPLASGFNLVITKFGMAQSVINAAVNAFGLAVGYSATTNVTHTTPGVVKNSFLNQPVGVGLTDTSSTLPVAPTYCMFCQSTPTATTNPNGIVIDLEGQIIIPPGGYIVTAAIAASPGSACWFALHWMEVAV